MEGTRRSARTAEGNLKGKSYVRQFGQRPRVDSELGVLPNIVSCTTYGFKGSFSEFELQGIKARLLGGQRSAAARGALKMLLPIGLAYDHNDEVVFDPDRSIVDAIGQVCRIRIHHPMNRTRGIMKQETCRGGGAPGRGGWQSRSARRGRCRWGGCRARSDEAG